jgi:amino acid adenylation domain-containing protein
VSSIQSGSFQSVGDFPIVVGNTTIEKKYPSTEAQLEVWLSSGQSIEANCAYNEISSLTFRGDLNCQQLESAIARVVERNDSLRSTFSPDGREVIVHRTARYSFEFVDWSDVDAAELEVKKLEVAQKQACTPFDLVAGPLLRIVLQKFSNNEHRMTFAAHHIVLDGWSLSVFCRDLGHFYDALQGAQVQPLPAASQYEQYSRTMAEYFDSAAGRADEAFWIQQFSDAIPVLDLPIEGTRPALRTYYGRRYDHTFSTELVERIRKLGAKSGCSLFNVMLAAFQAYVARLGSSDDFCVGIPTAGQAALDYPELIGHCVNTMPLRSKVDVTLPFTQFMKQSRGQLLDALDHQRYSFGTLLRKLAPPRDPSRPPMLSVSFNIDPAINVQELGFTGLEVELQIEPRMFENFEWFINGVIKPDKSIEMQVQYNADLYSSQSISFYFEGFEAFLTALADHPEARVDELPTMSLSQRETVICKWNDTAREYPNTSTLHAEVSRQAQQTPGKVAVEFADQHLTYQQLEQQSNRIARCLRARDIGPGDLVGICFERSHHMPVYLLGILKSGAGYVPLDPAYPAERLKYMCDHSRLKLVITEANLVDLVRGFDKPQLAIDSIAAEISSHDSGPVESGAGPADTCYVIYTSGSTGKPKGVCVPHGAVVNFLYSMQHSPGITANDSILAVTTLSFDIAVLELYLPLVSGGKLVIADQATIVDGIRLAEAIESHSISLLQATPATWRMLIQSGWNGKQDLKVLCGGEPMPTDLVAPLLDRCQELWNMYGPTETTVWSAIYQITDAQAPILIGKPIANTQIYILDGNGREVPVGAEGEVFIGGAGVTLGYLHQPEMTDERFVHNPYFSPFAETVNHRLYKTGDLAKYRFNGNIQFFRRNDKQVKVRGYRIELSEIEKNLNTHPAIEQNVVIVREDSPGDTRLVAYYLTKPGAAASPQELRDQLQMSLPPYMVPQHFVQLSRMPRTNNGKLDVNALPAPTRTTADPANDERPRTEPEKYLANVWRELIEVDDISVHDNFFELGGHSLLVMQVITRVHEQTGVRLGPQDFLIGSLEQLADKISGADLFGKVASTGQADSSSSQTATIDGSSDEPAESADREGSALQKIGIRLKGFWN